MKANSDLALRRSQVSAITISGMYVELPNLTETSPEDLKVALANPGFGKYFTDRMAAADWSVDQGWHDHRIDQTSKWAFHPGAAVFHYGQEIFEGMKAYRHPDDSVWLFRPVDNAARFARSARRMAMPPLPEDEFVAAVQTLIHKEQRWVPESHGEQSLYIRPFMVATETLIGVREARNYRFAVIATPAQPFYADPLSLWVTPNFSRSATGGTGAAKCGGNYAGSLAAEAEAHQNGCNQVLWLDSATATQVEECGTMNFLVVTADNRLLTPALTGNILAGITRDSLLKLASAHGLTPVEETLTLDQLKDGIESGQVAEALACGTAAVVSPVVSLKAPTWQVQIGDGKPGPKTMDLRQHLTDIQFGRAQDPFGWTVKV